MLTRHWERRTKNILIACDSYVPPKKLSFAGDPTYPLKKLLFAGGYNK